MYVLLQSSSLKLQGRQHVVLPLLEKHTSAEVLSSDATGILGSAFHRNL
jgi:hypothetical protein